MRYGDVLVLVRQRGELFEAIIRALKDEGVEVAGADRLMLTDHIAVMDLIALADALLLPEDDLALATVLRSPLFGFQRRRPFRDRVGSRPSSLRAALTRKERASEKFFEAAALLDKLAEAARRQTPFAFYAQILGRRAAGGVSWHGLATKRMTRSTNSSISRSTMSGAKRRRCRAFFAWLRQARAEVKRDMEIARDEVRVMTVHGAKGLEAPIVILADTMTPPGGPKPPRLLDARGRRNDLGGT